MRRSPIALFVLVLLVSLNNVDGAASSASGARGSSAEYLAVERFLSEIDRPPVAYQARRWLEARSAKLNESAWLEALTEYSPETGFSYRVVSHGGSERIRNRVLKRVLEVERESSTDREWPKGALSHDNYEFSLDGRTPDGMIRVRLDPRRRDSRLVAGTAIVLPDSGQLVRVEGRLAKSPSFWVRWVTVTRRYTAVADTVMPVALESTADVRIAGVSRLSMTYQYQTIDGVAVPPLEAPRVLLH